MKKSSYVLKFVCAILLIVFGITVLILGISEAIGGYYYYTYTNDVSYGGDAYTGIQNAAADTANNVGRLGYLVEGIVAQLYILSGILCIIIAMYWLAGVLAIDKTKISKPETSLDTLGKYKNLLDSGVISQEEFETMKKQLLNI